jgi:hypothetical protein
MKRLFYFTGYRISVQHWKGTQLVGSSSFEPTEPGLEQFRHYLLNTENIPGKLLVDVIEEDFRNETIPHVGSKDRKSVISRLLDRYYRSSGQFSYSEIIGREKAGRKDDIVLLGAMTNQKLIQPWLSIFDECEVALSGIWTLPLISKNLLKTIGAANGVTLLISQQVNSNVRQTLFRNGKLISSRTSIINQDINNISEVGKLASPEVARTIDFLRTQGHVDRSEVINLHIIGADEQIVSLQQSFHADDRQTVSIHTVADIHKKLGVSGIGEQFSNGIFAWLCLNKTIASSHYGASKLFNRYHNKLAAMALYAASLFAVIAGVLMTQSYVSNALEFEKSTVLLKQEEQQYKQLYTNKFKDFEKVFQNAGVMNSAVELAERITLNGSTSPLDFLIGLSNILAQDGSRDIAIDKIEWKAVSLDARSQQLKKANFTGNDEVKHNAIVSGRIDDPENNYRASITHIQQIIKYLQDSNRIESVEVLQMPVDLRSESKFSSQSGVNIQQDKRTDKEGVFSFEITMRAPENV